MADPFFSNVVLLAINDNKANGTTTFLDQSSAARTLTPAGNAKYSTASAPSGMTSTGLFDGAGDVLQAADAADLELGTSNFVLEAFISPLTIVGNQSLITKRRAGFVEGFNIYRESGTLNFYGSSNGSTWDIASAKPFGAIAVGTWYHIAVVRSGNNFYTFLNGTQGATWTSALAFQNNALKFSIANTQTPGQGDDYNGYLGPIRLSIGTDRGWTGATITVPTLPYPITAVDPVVSTPTGTIISFRAWNSPKEAEIAKARLALELKKKRKQLAAVEKKIAVAEQKAERKDPPAGILANLHLLERRAEILHVEIAETEINLMGALDFLGKLNLGNEDDDEDVFLLL